jgi:hypothetical protein
LAKGGREGEELEKGAGKHGGGDTVGRAVWQPGHEAPFFRRLWVLADRFDKICLEVGTLPAKRTLRTGQPGKIILLSASSLQSQKPHI